MNHQYCYPEIQQRIYELRNGWHICTRLAACVHIAVTVPVAAYK